jgi:tRNA (guanine-N7-)-methyltransferase
MSEDRLIHSFGRRRGRKLRAGRAALLDTLLPALRVELPDDGAPVDPARVFATPPREVWLEIGFGGGEHLAWQAAANPDIGLIGCEPYENGIVALLGHVRDGGLGNVRIWPDDARPLLELLAPGSVARAFVLFPDPWPKARHAKRRFVHPEMLKLVARVLKPGAEWRIASDDPTYQAWTAEVLAAQTLFDVPAPATTRPEGWPPTRYEAKALAAGRVPRYWAVRRRG